jgi:hypothetical protein
MEREENKPVALTKLLPFEGKEKLLPNEPRYFINGKKLIMVMRKVLAKGKDGKSLNVVIRRMKGFVDDKTPKGMKIRKILRDMKIPGA